MIRRRNVIRLILLMLLAFIIAILGLKFIDLKKIIDQGDDFHYSVISFSVTLSGFLFTNIGILISAISNEGVKRLWDNEYLDDLYYSNIVGIIASILSLVLAIIQIWYAISISIVKWLIRGEILCQAIAIIFFVWCIYRIISVLSKLKK